MHGQGLYMMRDDKDTPGLSTSDSVLRDMLPFDCVSTESFRRGVGHWSAIIVLLARAVRKSQIGIQLIKYKRASLIF